MSCKNQTGNGDLYRDKSSKPINVGSSFVIDGTRYHVESELTNGMQANVFKAVGENRRHIVLKVPKDQSASPFAHPAFFNSYANFTANLDQAYFFHITSQKRKTVTTPTERFSAYVSDYVDGTSLGDYLKNNYLESIEKEYLGEKLAVLFKDMHKLSIERDAYISDVAKLDNIMVTADGANLQIIDAIVIDDSIPRENMKLFKNQALSNPERLKRIYMHWGFAALHTMITGHELYGSEITNIISSYLQSYIKPKDMAGDFPINSLNKMTDLINESIVLTEEELFKFQINPVPSEQLVESDEYVQSFAKALNDFHSFREKYIKPEGLVNYVALDIQLPPTILCAR